MSELKPCAMCGAKHRDLMGYDFHKVSCSDEDCPISSLALTKEQWNTRAADGELTKENARLREALLKSNEAFRDNLSMFAYKNEGAMYECYLSNEKLLTELEKGDE